MFRKILRQAGFMLIANSALFTPLIASADSGDSTYAVIGFPAGAVITGLVLVSMSKTKSKATKADKYVKGTLELHDRADVYVKTETTKTKVN